MLTRGTADLLDWNLGDQKLNQTWPILTAHSRDQIRIGDYSNDVSIVVHNHHALMCGRNQQMENFLQGRRFVNSWNFARHYVRNRSRRTRRMGLGVPFRKMDRRN